MALGPERVYSHQTALSIHGLLGKCPGKCPDQELAEKFGRTRQATITKRSILGIIAFITKGETGPWSLEEESLLGTGRRRLGILPFLYSPRHCVVDA